MITESYILFIAIKFNPLFIITIQKRGTKILTFKSTDKQPCDKFTQEAGAPVINVDMIFTRTHHFTTQLRTRCFSAIILYHKLFSTSAI